MKNAFVAGASGLVGTALVKQLLDSTFYGEVHILVRRELDWRHPKLIQHVVVFEHLEDQTLGIKVEDAFCTLGTTIANAGSKDAFARVDHDYVLSFAAMSQVSGATGFFAVSSMGANPASSIFYNKVKGLMEEDLKKYNFPRLGIFRPSLLLGPRAEKRAGEKFASWMMKLLDFIIPLKYKAIHVDKVAAKMIEVALKAANGTTLMESDRLQ